MGIEIQCHGAYFVHTRVDAFAHEKLVININYGLTGERTKRDGTFSEMLNTDYGRGKRAKTQSSIFRKNQRYSKVDASSPLLRWYGFERIRSVLEVSNIEEAGEVGIK